MSRASPEAAAQAADAVFYPVKWILDEKGSSVPICMQARNGPCALLALVNVNLQKRTFTLEPGTTRMQEEHLMAILADYVSTRPNAAPTASSDQAAFLHQHAVSDFLDLLPRLNRGMDINVRFNAPTSFEFTRELGVFDIFPAVRLLHGWLVDPQDHRLAEALGSLSYNQVIDELVRTASPAPPPPPPPDVEPDEEQDALVHMPSAPPLEAFEPQDGPDAPSFATDLDPAALPGLPEESEHTTAIREIRPFVMDFLESNPTQLTVYGLTELHSVLAEGETSVLFRNSHFYVIRKHASELYTLVTDVGYLNELNTVWEKLSDVNGDSTFYNGSFQRISDSGTVAGPPPPPPKQSRPQSAGPRPQQPSAPVPPYWAGPPPVGSAAPQRPRASSSLRPGRGSNPSGRQKSTEKCVVQ